MADFPALVTMRTSLMPARAASSTVYWIPGLSMTGIISFGTALLAGRKRVPRPAAGMIAFFTCTAGLPSELRISGRSLRCQFQLAACFADAIAALLFGAIEGLVRRFHQTSEGVAVFRVRRHSDRDSQGDGLVAHSTERLRLDDL